jgi:hypothetical protein
MLCCIFRAGLWMKITGENGGSMGGEAIQKEML